MEPTDPTHPFSDSRSPQASPQQPPSSSSLPSTLDPRRRSGRPAKLTREVHDAIVSAIESGAYVKIAAQAAGVGASTLAGWLARGREAAAASAQHEEGRLFCPSCDLDRTIDVRRVEQHNANAAETPDEEERSYAVLDRCPQCRTHDDPVEWQLPEEEAPYLELLEAVTHGQANAEVAAVAAWRAAWRDDWRAARDYLARTAPERWAGVTRVQMTTEEAERRIDDAVNEALLAVGIDLPDRDPLDAALDEGLDP